MARAIPSSSSIHRSVSNMTLTGIADSFADAGMEENVSASRASVSSTFDAFISPVPCRYIAGLLIAQYLPLHNRLFIDGGALRLYEIPDICGWNWGEIE